MLDNISHPWLKAKDILKIKYNRIVKVRQWSGQNQIQYQRTSKIWWLKINTGQSAMQIMIYDRIRWFLGHQLVGRTNDIPSAIIARKMWKDFWLKYWFSVLTLSFEIIMRCYGKSEKQAAHQPVCWLKWKRCSVRSFGCVIFFLISKTV